jgi:hypothetical protein
MYDMLATIPLAVGRLIDHHIARPDWRAPKISTRLSGFGRPFLDGRARTVELERTACYACTGWHTCLVFLIESGLRLPLCDGCLPVVVERAVNVRALAS